MSAAGEIPAAAPFVIDVCRPSWKGRIGFTEYHDLEGAFGRRAITERAKGILMERHSVDEPTAFQMLRDHSRASNRKLVDVSSAVADGHGLLPKQRQVTRSRGRSHR
jgi:hypothetical protein